jgi:hypothetical protein
VAGKNLSILARPAGRERFDGTGSMGQGRSHPTPGLFLLEGEMTMNLPTVAFFWAFAATEY